MDNENMNIPAKDILYIEYTDVNKCKIVTRLTKEVYPDFGVTKAWEIYKSTEELYCVDRKLIVNPRNVIYVNPFKQKLVLASDFPSNEHIVKTSSSSKLQQLKNEIVAIAEQEIGKKDKILLNNRNECFCFFKREMLYLTSRHELNNSDGMDNSSKESAGTSEASASAESYNTIICFMNGQLYKTPFGINEADQVINGLPLKRRVPQRCCKFSLVNMEQVKYFDMPRLELVLTDAFGDEVGLKLPRKALHNYQKKWQEAHYFAEFIIMGRRSGYELSRECSIDCNDWFEKC